jgi:hypothetical protein
LSSGYPSELSSSGTWSYTTFQHLSWCFTISTHSREVLRKLAITLVRAFVFSLCLIDVLYLDQLFETSINHHITAAWRVQTFPYSVSTRQAHHLDMAFSPMESRLHPISSNPYPMSSSAATFEPAYNNRRMSLANGVNEISSMEPATVVLRRLPRNTTTEAVRTMLLFAKDLHDTEIVPNEFEEDSGFTTAIARFASFTGAAEAQAMLDGKPNTAGQAKMIVDVLGTSAMTQAQRRNTIDPATSRKIAQSVSPPMNMAQKSSRFNGTFQSMDKHSPPLLGSPPEHSSSETSSNLQSMFSPQSPATDRARISGKKVIGEDAGDDDTREFLKDPLAYMNNSSVTQPRRKQTDPRGPIAAFSALSLNTGMTSGASSDYASPRSAVHGRSGHGSFSPSTAGPGGPFSPSAQTYIRHNYPPVNPADQNPPCNTLYVGNLPVDTSEDELKAMFSKQRGYRRLCFRTKQNGPMCFVEFEDVSFATKALNELYGAQLHNSVKGGIRLSFSKNPLGVRAGHAGSNNAGTPISHGVSGPMTMSPNGFASGTPPGNFSTANGPPPGLSAPPGLNMAIGSMNGMVPGPSISPQFMNQSLGGAMSNTRGMALNNAGPGANLGGMYPDYMLGR